MFPRCLAVYLLLILLTISALNHGVLEARFLTEKHLKDQEKPQKTWKLENHETVADGFFATINREVPSSPDPLHNR
ncbi:hypothetical protein PTKIN_Ptkin06aG0204400 [Pterospermum kingtungense]